MSLRKIVEREGDGKSFPRQHDHVTVSYNSWLYDPTKSSSMFRGRQIGESMNSVTIQLGKGVFISACEAEILKMTIGERAFLVIPGSKAYGSEGIPSLVPPNTDIVILIEVLGLR